VCSSDLKRKEKDKIIKEMKEDEKREKQIKNIVGENWYDKIPEPSAEALERGRIESIRNTFETFKNHPSLHTEKYKKDYIEKHAEEYKNILKREKKKSIQDLEYIDHEVNRIVNEPLYYEKLSKVINDRRKKRIYPLELAGILGKQENTKIFESVNKDPKKLFKIFKEIAEELSTGENIIENKIDNVKKGWFNERDAQKIRKELEQLGIFPLINPH